MNRLYFDYIFDMFFVIVFLSLESLISTLHSRAFFMASTECYTIRGSTAV